MHPLEQMSGLEKLEMQLEWEALVEKMNLTTVLGEKGFEFSTKMFKEAYSRGFIKGTAKGVEQTDEPK